MIVSIKPKNKFHFCQGQRGTTHTVQGWKLYLSPRQPESFSALVTPSGVKVYKQRFGIEAMFRDYKSGGYNLEGSQASPERLVRLVLLIAIALTAAWLEGESSDFIGRVKGYKSYTATLIALLSPPEANASTVNCQLSTILFSKD